MKVTNFFEKDASIGVKLSMIKDGVEIIVASGNPKDKDVKQNKKPIVSN